MNLGEVLRGARWRVRLADAGSPVRTLLVLLVTLGVAEVLADALFVRLIPASRVESAPAEVAIKIALAFPALVFLVLLPMARARAERRRVEEALRRKTGQLEALSTVMQAATKYLDPDRLLAEVVDAVLPVFEADGGWAVVWGEESGGSPRTVGGKGVPESLLAPELARLQAIPEELLRSAGFAQHLGIVLPALAHLGVVLNLVWRAPRRIEGLQTDLVDAIGLQLGVALENAALFKAETEARVAAETLRSASLAITRSLALDDVLSAFFLHLAKLVPFERAKVMLLEGESRLRVRAVFSPVGRTDFPGRPLGSFAVRDNPILGEILELRRSLYVPDTRERAVWAPSFPEGGERSWLGVPLTAGGRAIGLYSLVRAEPSGFTPEQVRMAEALSAPTSVALAHTFLFEEVDEARKRLGTLSRRLVEVQEGERKRIARELHDEAGQCLSSLKVGLRLLEGEAAEPEAVVRRVEVLRGVVDWVQDDLLRLAADLRPAAIDHVGLSGALEELASSLRGHGGPDVEVEVSALRETRLAPEVEVGLYRIAQEAVTNAIRHAKARHISLVVSRRDDRCILVVEDDGRGFDVEAAMRSGRLGLVGIRERTEMLGGTLLVECGEESGTTLVVEVPDAY